MTTSNQKNIPALRFKEFDGEWEKDRISNLFIIKVGGAINKKNVSSFKNKEFPYPIYANAEKKKGLYGYSSVYKFKGGVVTITGRGNIGIAHARNHAFFPIVSLLVLIPKKDADICFYEYAFNNLNFSIESTGVPQLTSRQLSTYKVFFPSLPEQQKIASFLTAIDQKINQLSRKVQLQERYKKGVMQKLFSQELRFKDADGKDFAEWEEKRLKVVIDDFIVPMRDKPKDLTGDIPWCRIEDFDGRYLSQSKSKQGVSWDTILNMNLKVFPINTLLVSCSAYLGRCAIVKKELITNQTFIGLVPNEKLINIEYLYYIMGWNEQKLNRLSSGTTISYLSRREFENFKIFTPSLPEQQKIAHFLSQLDEQIQQTGQQLAHLQDYKKGLLQQLFV